MVDVAVCCTLRPFLVFDFRRALHVLLTSHTTILAAMYAHSLFIALFAVPFAGCNTHHDAIHALMYC